MKITKRAQRIVDEFDNAAQSWGWQSDQGVGNEVDRADKEHKETSARLVRFIARLQRIARIARRKGKAAV